MVQELKAPLPSAETIESLIRHPVNMAPGMLGGFLMAIYYIYKDQPTKPNGWEDLRARMESESAKRIQNAYRRFKERQSTLQEELMQTCKDAVWKVLAPFGFTYNAFNKRLTTTAKPSNPEEIYDELIRIQSECANIDCKDDALCLTNIVDPTLRKLNMDALKAFVEEMQDTEHPTKPPPRTAQPAAYDCYVEIHKVMQALNELKTKEEVEAYYKEFMATFRRRCTKSDHAAYASLETMFAAKRKQPSIRFQPKRLTRESLMLKKILRLSTDDAEEDNDWD